MYADAATTQCRHLSNLISKVKFEASSAATAVNLLKDLHAPTTCKDDLIGQVTDKVIADGQGDEEAADGPGNNQQCFMSIVNYLTSDQWGSKDFESEMVSTANQLGLKNPTEDTCAVIVACAEAQSRGLQEARRLTYTHLYEHVQSMKKAIKKDTWAATGIHVLPATPDQLLLKHPDVYRRVFTGKVIMPMPYERISFEALLGKVPRRSSHAGYQAEQKAMQASSAMVPGNWMQSNNAMVPTMMDMQASSGMALPMQQMQHMIRAQQMQMQQMQMQIMKQLQLNSDPADTNELPGLSIFGPGGSPGSQSSGRQTQALQDRPAVLPAPQDRQQPEAPQGHQAVQKGGQLAIMDATVPGYTSSVPDDSPTAKPCKRKSVAETTELLLAGLKKSKKIQHQSEDDSEDVDDASEEVPKKKSKKKKKPKKKQHRSEDASENVDDETKKPNKKSKKKKKSGHVDDESDSKKTYRALCIKNIIWD